jgi:hypothetical protein
VENPRNIEPTSLEEAVLRTVAYGDVFDAPLTPQEIHRYVERVPARRWQIDRAVERLSGAPLATVDGLVCLAGRESLVDLRRRREAVAAMLWPKAEQCARSVARLPWVRMVALTGALAMDNVDEGADVDLLIVTEPGRVWLCRFFVIQTVRIFRLRGVELCPNWLLSTERLELERKDFHSARELMQMVPLAGLEVYRRMREVNRWADDVLPNASGPPREVPCLTTGGSWLARWGEPAMRGRLGTTAEGWMARRKIREIRSIARDSSEVVLDRHQCKGHVDAHGQRIADAYTKRLESLSIAPARSAMD